MHESLIFGDMKHKMQQEDINMPKSIVNLTMPLVVSEMEQVLEAYPPYPEQQIFADSDLRQELIAYVLTRIPNKHVAVEASGESASAAEAIFHPMEIKLKIEDFIHQGIRHILQKYECLLR
jgi:hypothetical protein